MKKIYLIFVLIFGVLMFAWCQKMNPVDQCKNDCLDVKKTDDKACLEDQECAKTSKTKYDTCIETCTQK